MRLSLGRPHRQILLRLLGPTALLLVLVAGWLGVRGYTAWRDLTEAKRQIVALEQAFTVDTDPAALAPRLAAISRDTAAARAATEDRLWRAAARLPLVGRNFRTVAAAAHASDTVAQRILPALAGAAVDLRQARTSPAGQGLPLAPVGAAATRLADAAVTVERAAASVRAAPASLLIPPVAAGRAELLGDLDRLHARIRPLGDTTAILPTALGAAGPRTYFVGFVNPAEARGGGGLLGSYAIIRADRGRLTVQSVGANSDLPNLPTAPTGLSADFEQRYRAYGAATDWNVSNLSPHFPYTGEVWAEMYRSLTGRRIDGVLSLDPHALAVLLRATGPLTVADRQIGADNLVRFLERDQYALPLTAQARKDALGTVARAAMEQLLRRPGAVDDDLLRRLADAADAGHLRFMSTHPDEQALVARYPLAGVVPQTTQPFAAAFVNNAGSGKLDTYLDSRLEYAVTSCRPRREVTVTVVLRNGAPTSNLPAYVTVRADRPADEPASLRPRPGQNASLLGVMLTSGARLKSATLDGQPIGEVPSADGDGAYLDLSTERGHPVVSVPVDLAPQASATLRLEVEEPPNTRPPLLLRQPMARPQAVEVKGSCP